MQPRLMPLIVCFAAGVLVGAMALLLFNGDDAKSDSAFQSNRERRMAERRAKERDRQSSVPSSDSAATSAVPRDTQRDSSVGLDGSDSSDASLNKEEIESSGDTRSPRSRRSSSGRTGARYTKDTVWVDPADARTVNDFYDEGEAFNLDEPFSGSGEITGVVLDAEHQPVAGITIRVTPQIRKVDKALGNDRNGVPLEESPEDYAARLSQVKVWQQTNRLATQSGSDGTFAIGGMGPAKYTIEAFGANYTLKLVKGRGTVIPGDKVEYLATKRSYALLDLKREDDLAFDKGVIYYKRSDGPYNPRAGFFGTRWYASTREVELPPGQYIVYATGGAYAEYKSWEYQLYVPKDGPPPELSLVLRRTNVIQVDLEFGDDGYTREDVRVLITQGSGGNAEQYKRNTWGMAWVNGVWERSKMEPGTYTVGVFHGGLLLKELAVDAGEGLRSYELLVPAPRESDHMIVWVKDPNGNLIRDAYVSGRVLRREDGSHWVQLPQSKEPPKRIFVKSSLYGSISVDAPAAGQSVEAQFRESADILIKINNYDGSAAYHGDIVAVASSGTKSSTNDIDKRDDFHMALPNKSGERRIAMIQPQEVTVSLFRVMGKITVGYRESNNRTGLLLSKKHVRIDPGENIVEMALPKLFTLTVSVEEPTSIGYLKLFPARDIANWKTAYVIPLDSSSHSATLVGLPADTYLVATYKASRDVDRYKDTGFTANVDLNKDSSVTLLSDEFDIVRVYRSKKDDHATYIGRLNLQDKDIIVDVSPRPSNDSSLYRYLSKQPQVTTLTVLRDGKLMTYNPPEIVSPDKLDHGGGFSPSLSDKEADALRKAWRAWKAVEEESGG